MLLPYTNTICAVTVLLLPCTNTICVVTVILLPYTNTICVVTVILLPCTVYRITHTHTRNGTPRSSHTTQMLLRWFLSNDYAVTWPSARSHSWWLMSTQGEWNVLVPVFENMLVKTSKVYSSCMLQWMLNLMELCKSCCYAIRVSDLGWSHKSFHEYSVRKLYTLLSDVLFHGGATLAMYIDCQQALPELRISKLLFF